MTTKRTIWDSSTVASFTLIAGAAGLIEGIRAASTTPGTYAQEFTAMMCAVVASMGLAFLFAPPLVSLLRWAFGGANPEDQATPRSSTRRFMLRATLIAVVAAVLGLTLEDAIRATFPDASPAVRVLLSAGLTLFAFAGVRHLIESASVRKTVAVPGALGGLLLLSVALQIAGTSNRLPTDIDSGNRAPVADTVGWTGDAPPNFLFIVLDTTRLDRLSLYGYGLPTSPYLDRFAEESLVYDRAISTAPWTLPSHASMFTGLWPRIHQATEEHRLLRDEFTTSAEVLLRHGYETVGFSSNSVVGRSHNLQQGFQRFFEVSGDFLHHPVTPFQALLPIRVIDRFVRPVGWRDKGAQKANTLACRWLDEWERRADRRPFFAFVNYLEGHLPYCPPPRMRSRFGVGDPSPEILPLVSFKFRHGDIYRLIGYNSLLDSDDYRQLGAMYDASLAYQDERLGELIEDVRRRGILDQTVVIVVSDHGENLGDHGGLLGHAFSVHQTLIHVPLVIRYPKAFAAGSRYPGAVSTASIFPTILALAGAEPDSAWPPNVAPLPTMDMDPPSADLAISEYSVPVWELYNLAVEARGVDIGPMILRQQAIQDKDWKLVRNSSSAMVLYHLATDPGESTPLDPQQRSDGQRLHALLEEHLDALARLVLPPIGAEPELDQPTRDGLRSLGYAE